MLFRLKGYLEKLCCAGYWLNWHMLCPILLPVVKNHRFVCPWPYYTELEDVGILSLWKRSGVARAHGPRYTFAISTLQDLHSHQLSLVMRATVSGSVFGISIIMSLLSLDEPTIPVLGCSVDFH